MAEALARLQHVPESLTTFQGVNLRKDRLSLRDEDVARAINVDLHTRVGTALLRRGRTLVYSLPGDAGVLRYQAALTGSRYAIAGTTLYKDGAGLVTGLDAQLISSLFALRPLNDGGIWTFLGDRSGMQKELVGNVYPWGIAAPSVPPTLAGAGSPGLSGVYRVVYTYVRKDGGLVAHESNPSAASADLLFSNQMIQVNNLDPSGDPQVTHKRLYRTVNGGSTYLYDQEVLNSVTSAVSSSPDDGLGSAVEMDNNLPVRTGVVLRHQEHAFLVGPSNQLYWSKRFRPESVPTRNALTIGSASDPLLGAVSLVGLLGVFTARTKYRVLGNDTSGFVAQEALSSRGTPAPQAALVTEKGCLFPARDGLFRTNFVQEDEELSTLIAPLFEGETVNEYLPINWAAASSMALTYWKSRLYLAYPSGDHTTPDMLAVYSFHTTAWYFYQLRCESLHMEVETDQILAGYGTQITALETGTSDLGQPIQMTLEPASRSMSRTSLAGRVPQLVRKRFDYLRVDCDARSGRVVCEVFVDDRLVQYVTLTGTRTRRLLRLGPVQGYTWHVRFTYRGTEPVSVSGVEMLAVPLEAA